MASRISQPCVPPNSAGTRHALSAYQFCQKSLKNGMISAQSACGHDQAAGISLNDSLVSWFMRGFAADIFLDGVLQPSTTAFDTYRLFCTTLSEYGGSR